MEPIGKTDGLLLLVEWLTGTAAGNLTKTIAAEDRRALLAEKRRAYAQFHGSVDDVVDLAKHMKERAKGEADLEAALMAMHRAAAAVRLIASDEVAELARSTGKEATDESRTARAGTPDFDQDKKIYNLRQELYEKMRADLGVDDPPEHTGWA